MGADPGRDVGHDLRLEPQIAVADLASQGSEMGGLPPSYDKSAFAGARVSAFGASAAHA